MTEPLRLSWEVACPAGQAFATWTGRFGDWWPASHSASGDPDGIVLEPRPGGRIFERTRDGVEIDWGVVTRWEPPRRLGYRWHLRRSPEEATDVEVTFVDLGDGTTRLDIVQTGWERLGADAEAWRTRNHDGWAGLLPHFAAAAVAASTITTDS